VTRRSAPRPPRLSPALLHLLLALTDGPKHGYALMLEARERTGGRVRLGPGSLYWALDRLAETDLISETVAPPPTTDESAASEERRRYWRLTDAGRERLREEAGSLAALVDLARVRGVL
jgi:DNA-binding PadR family transcriptional regulator